MYLLRARGFSGEVFYKELPLATPLVSLFVLLKSLRRREIHFVPCYKGINRQFENEVAREVGSYQVNKYC